MAVKTTARRLLLNKKTIIIVIIIAAAAAGYWYYRNKNSGTQETRYQITQATKGNLEIKVTGSGQIYAESQVDLKATVSGDGLEVSQVNVKNNDEVTKDQVLVVLDSSDASKAIKDAQYDLQSAEEQYKITKEEYSKKTRSDTVQRTKQEITIQQRQLALSEAYEKLADYSIKAPFDGVITNFELEPGDSVSTEDTIGSVITNEKYALISLNEVDAAKITVGSPVTLTFDALEDLTIQGEVEKLDPIGEVNQGVVSYNAKIKLGEQNDQLKIGMSVSAEITIESKENVITVANTAIQNFGDQNFIQTATIKGQQSYDELGRGGRGNFKMVEPNTIEIQRTAVTLGLTDDVNTEITSGLEAGDIIVVQQLNLNAENETANGSSNNSSGNSSILPAGGPGGGRGGRM